MRAMGRSMGRRATSLKPRRRVDGFEMTQTPSAIVQPTDTSAMSIHARVTSTPGKNAAIRISGVMGNPFTGKRPYALELGSLLRQGPAPAPDIRATAHRQEHEHPLVCYHHVNATPEPPAIRHHRGGITYGFPDIRTPRTHPRSFHTQGCPDDCLYPVKTLTFNTSLTHHSISYTRG